MPRLRRPDEWIALGQIRLGDRPKMLEEALFMNLFDGSLHRRERDLGNDDHPRLCHVRIAIRSTRLEFLLKANRIVKEDGVQSIVDFHQDVTPIPSTMSFERISLGETAHEHEFGGRAVGHGISALHQSTYRNSLLLNTARHSAGSPCAATNSPARIASASVGVRP